MTRTLHYEILVDRAERPQKCTILPQADRPDFKVIRFERGVALPAMTVDFLLHIDGAPLDELRPQIQKSERIGLIDCHWKRCAAIYGLLAPPAPRLARIPDGFLTAYPRRNKQNLDPDGGLATIEALFIAAAFCGVWDESLLDKYHFAAEFLAINAAIFNRFALNPQKPA